MKYAALGEDKSDSETIKAIIRVVAGDISIPVQARGYGGKAGLLKKGAKDLRTYSSLGFTRFVIVHDADCNDPESIRLQVCEQVVAKAGLKTGCCVVVPVQEIEAWILADLKAVTSVLTGWRPRKDFPSPEGIDNPKEELERLSRMSNKKPRYSHVVHNPRVAEHLDWRRVQQKCPSFQPLVDLIAKGESNI